MKPIDRPADAMVSICQVNPKSNSNFLPAASAKHLPNNASLCPCCPKRQMITIEKLEANKSLPFCLSPLLHI